MKKLGYILLLSLPFLSLSCGQKTERDTSKGYGADNPQYDESSESGAGRVDETGMGADVSNDGGTRNNTTNQGDSLQKSGEAGATDAARATKKTKTQVGNSQTRGEPAGTEQE